MSEENVETKDEEIVMIPVENLYVDIDSQSRDEIDEEQVARFEMSDSDEWPPLIVTPDTEIEGDFLVIDGWHRVTANAEGPEDQYRGALPCIIRDGIGYEESCEENLKHRGLQLSTSERKAYAVFLHETYPELSGREITRRVGLALSTVQLALRGEKPGGQKSGKVTPSLPRALLALVKTESEGGTTDAKREKYVTEVILDAKDPQAVIDALDIWLDPLTEGLEVARAQFSNVKEV